MYHLDRKPSPEVKQKNLPPQPLKPKEVAIISGVTISSMVKNQYGICTEKSITDTQGILTCGFTLNNQPNVRTLGIHKTGILTYMNGWFFMVDESIYTSPMDAMGCSTTPSNPAIQLPEIRDTQVVDIRPVPWYPVHL